MARSPPMATPKVATPFPAQQDACDVNHLRTPTGHTTQPKRDTQNPSPSIRVANQR